MAPIFLLALGAAVGAWIWLLTQSTKSIEEVFQTPEAGSLVFCFLLVLQTPEKFLVCFRLLKSWFSVFLFFRNPHKMGSPLGKQ